MQQSISFEIPLNNNQLQEKLLNVYQRFDVIKFVNFMAYCKLYSL